MKVRHDAIIADAIDIGVRSGFSRIFKHADTLQAHDAENAIGLVHQAVWTALCEVYDFADEPTPD